MLVRRMIRSALTPFVTRIVLNHGEHRGLSHASLCTSVISVVNPMYFNSSYHRLVAKSRMSPLTESLRQFAHFEIGKVHQLHSLVELFIAEVEISFGQKRFVMLTSRKLGLSVR